MKRLSWLFASILIAGSSAPSYAQKFDNLERERMRDVLRLVSNDVRKNYYDPKMGGFDFEAHVREADEKLKKAESLSQSLNIIAWALDPLNDSHTVFVPPGRTTRQEYGWRMEMMGTRCFVTRVQPKSDAESKGLKPGDEILAINGVAPTRDTLPTLNYIYQVLSPRAALKLQVRSPEGETRELVVAARVVKLRKQIDLTGARPEDLHNLWWEEDQAEGASRTKCIDFKDSDLGICKMRFFEMDDDHVRDLVNFARKHTLFILDLRGNPGGYVSTMTHLVSGFVDHEVKIADRTGRKPDLKPQVAKEQKSPYTGKFVVLVDSESGSSSELFARVMQLEKRATVIGDRSAGAVMEARFYPHLLGADTAIFFGVTVTDANLIMADGKSLEHVGVTPDEIVLPSPADLAAGRDPVISRAAESLGVKLSPEQAGKLFPYEWPKL